MFTLTQRPAKKKEMFVSFLPVGASAGAGERLRFGTPVALQPHRLRLRPLESHNLRIESSTLEILPTHSIRWYRDALGNSVATATFNGISDTLRVLSEVIIAVYDDTPLDFLMDDYAPTRLYTRSPSSLISHLLNRTCIRTTVRYWKNG